MKNFIVLCMAFVATIFVLCTKDPLTGTTDDTDTGIVANIYMPGGVNPAQNATVHFFKKDATVPFDSATTDANGRFSTGKITDTCSVYAMKDSLALFVGVVVPRVKKEGALFIDTLSPMKSLSGIVGMQPGDNPQTVIVNVLGTEIYANVAANGWFKLEGIVQGTYKLRLTTNLPDYTTSFYTQNAPGLKADTIADTLKLIYTGIPVVTGIKAQYDTVNGVVHLSWIPVSYANFQKYVIYRQEAFDVKPATEPLAVTVLSSYSDTVYKKIGANAWSDTNAHTFVYRVKVRDNFDVDGRSYLNANLTTIPPGKTGTTTLFSIAVDTVSPNDSVKVVARVTSGSRLLTSVRFAVDDTLESVKTLTMPDLGVSKISDTFFVSSKVVGNHQVYSIVTDNGNSRWISSTSFTVIADHPTAFAGNDTSIVTGTPVVLRGSGSDRFGKITKTEWDVGGTGNFASVKVGESFSYIPLVVKGVVKAILRVTDDDGMKGLDTVLVTINQIIITSPKKDSIATGLYTFSGSTDTSVQKVSLQLESSEWLVANGTSNWSLPIDTRFFYPADTLSLKIKIQRSDSSIVEQEIKIKVSNQDPLIGFWRPINWCLPDAPNCFLENQRFFENGTCNAGLFGCSAQTWHRDSALVVINGSDCGTLQFTPRFFSWDYALINGIECLRCENESVCNAVLQKKRR